MLGHAATARWCEEHLKTCHSSSESLIREELAAAQRGEGPTLFDIIVDIIRIHGPGGDEADDAVDLELL